MTINNLNSIYSLNPEKDKSKENLDLSDFSFSDKKDWKKTSNIYKYEEVLKIENSELIKNMDQNEFENFVLEILFNNPRATKIDFSEILKEWYIHSNIYNIIWRNFPLVEISRLIKDQKVVDLTFMWVKKLNENISKEFVDIFSNKIKDILNSNFAQIIDWERPWRLIRNNYKHLTYSIRKDLNISKKIFWEEIDKEKIVKKAFYSINQNELNEIIKNSWKDYLTKEYILEQLENNFDFWIWASEIWHWNLKEKLTSFYKWEISSRNIADLENLNDSINYNFQSIKNNAKNALNIEKELINTFSDKSFYYNWVEYDIIVNWKISSILLKHIRKSEKIEWENSEFIKNEIEKYIKYLTDWFDFISPVINDEDFNETWKINKQITNWIIDRKLFTKTYKNTLSTQSLKQLTKWKKWARIFIDIVDMWIMNLNDFRDLAIKVDSWEISEENIDELLKAWETATKKFQWFVKNIKSIYNNARISIWWDEIFIFLEEKEENENPEIISNISELIQEFSLKWRISSSYNSNDNEIFNILDNTTIINKIFEKSFEWIIQENKSDENILLTSSDIIHLDIDDEKLHFINENLIIFINLIQKNISKNELYELINKWKNISKNIAYKIKSNTTSYDFRWNFEIEITKQNKLINIKIK